MHSPEIQKNPEIPAVPYRGDIIVDTSFLLNMVADIPKDPKNDDRLPPKNFIELLPFLAKNGYHIIIPEMVSYEAAGILASGNSISSLFNHDKFEHTHVVLSPLLKDAAATSKHKEDINISIKTNTGPVQIDSFLASMQKAVDDFGTGWEQKSKKMLRVMDKNMLTRRATDDAKYKLQDIKKQLGSYCGDDAIISLLEKDYKKHSDRNVVVLSDDLKLREEIRKDYPHINTITTGQFVYSMVNSKVTASAGLFPEMPAYEIETKRRQSNVRIARKPAHKLDNLHGDEQEYLKGLNSTAFAKSLIKLSEDLSRQEESNRQSPVDYNGEESRVAKFRAKYAKREQNLSESPIR